MKNTLLSLALLAAIVAAQAQSWTNYYSWFTPRAMVADELGNIIVTGHIPGSAPNGNDSITAKYSPSGVLLWSTNYKGSFSGPSIVSDEGYAVATDKSGNVLMVGESYNDGTGLDFITTKYSPAGDVLWRRLYTQADRAFGVATDSRGNAVVTGLQEAGGGGRYNVVTLKYSTNGTLLWIKSFPAGYVDWFSLKPVGVLVDYEDNIVVWGTKANSAVQPYDRDFVTLKYSAAGVPLWTNYFDGFGEDDIANAGIVDDAGNVLITGSTRPSWGGFLPTTHKYAKDGTLLWSADTGGDALALGPAGEVYATGTSGDGFVGYTGSTTKYSATGELLWTQTFAVGTNRYARPVLIAADKSGTVFVSGNYSDVPVGYNFDSLTFAYSSEGAVLWTNRYDNGGNNYAVALACDVSGNAILTVGSDPGGEMVLIKYAGAGLNSPPVLTMHRYGSEIVLSWTDPAFGLQSAPTISGTFTNIPGATSPYTNAVSGQRFFRLAQ